MGRVEQTRKVSRGETRDSSTLRASRAACGETVVLSAASLAPSLQRAELRIARTHLHPPADSLLCACSASASASASVPRCDSMSKEEAQKAYVAQLTQIDPKWEEKAGKIKSKL